jgi:hypothetical protein
MDGFTNKTERDFTVPSDWKKLRVPLGLVVATLVALSGLWAWSHAEFVLAQEYEQFKQALEVRGLERDKKQAENEVLKLEVKQDAYPKKFDAVDRAILKKQKADLGELNQALKEVKNRSMAK